MFKESRIYNNKFEKIYTHKNKRIEFNHKCMFASRARK